MTAQLFDPLKYRNYSAKLDTETILVMNMTDRTMMEANSW